MHIPSLKSLVWPISLSSFSSLSPGKTSLGPFQNLLKRSLFPYLFVCSALFGAGLLSPMEAYAQRQSLDLSGNWVVRVGDNHYNAQLPGSLDTNSIGEPTTDFTETTQLSRKYTYTGEAYYKRDIHIPTSWKGQHIELFLERTRPTTVWVDGKEVGSVDYLSAPHVYDLTEYLTPGNHTLTVMVDNGDRIPEQIKSNSHACTEATQTNWNGIIGQIRLDAMSKTRVTDIQCYPLKDNSLKVVVTVENPLDGVWLNVSSTSIGSGNEAVSEGTEPNATTSLKMLKGINQYEVILDLNEGNENSSSLSLNSLDPLNSLNPSISVETASTQNANSSLASDSSLGSDNSLNSNSPLASVASDSSLGSETSVNSINSESLISSVNPDNSISSVSSGSSTSRNIKWSHRNPVRQRVEVEIPGYDKTAVNTGLRSFTHDKHHFFVNDTLTFLRGKHDGCVFPLTGYTAMDVDQWRHYMQVCKDFGINHIRFHSWCPPEACFEAADIEGIYLQPELTIWGTFNREYSTLMDFLHADGTEIMRRYGNHPSFVMFSLGNELWGEEDLMDEFVSDFRAYDSRHMYALGSNAYLGYKGTQPAEDFFVTCRVGEGDGYDGYSSHSRASFSFADAYDGGLLNHNYPSSTVTFEDAVSVSEKPIIGHETGQYQIYPNYEEIEKYTGVLYPGNFEVFRQRLQDANLLSQAQDFFKASGIWSGKLYKADMEMNLRTPSMAGFQLLDLQDYPGQGSALIGVCDAFMDPKGVISEEDWRKSCDEVVILGLLPKFCYAAAEDLTGEVAVANYSGRELQSQEMLLTLRDQRGNKIFSKTLSVPQGQGYIGGESFSFTLPELRRGMIGSNDVFGSSNSSSDAHHFFSVKDVKASKEVKEAREDKTHKASRKKNKWGRHHWKARHNKKHQADNPSASVAYKLTLTMELPEDNVTNDYDIWVYPGSEIREHKNVVIATTINDALKAIDKGRNVLLVPNRQEVDSATVGGLFQTDYWNYRMFKTISENNDKPVSPGTMGILVDPTHPALEGYPTDIHTDWQWFTATKNGYPLILDALNPIDYRPIVQVIDNIERNHRLGLVSEFKVGKSNVIVATIDYQALIDKPEGRQLINSLVDYLDSDRILEASKSSEPYPTPCNKAVLTKDELVNLLTLPTETSSIEKLGNISYE